MTFVTVLMPVYNAEKYVAQAVESILGQTFTEFELLIVDDASTDATFDVVQSYQDPRIRLIQNDMNLGVTLTLNKGLEMAKGEYIARLDADDIADPRRLEIQKAFLNAHPQVGLVGSWFYMTDEIGANAVLFKKPSDNVEIQQKMLYFPVFAHSTVMFRLECVKRVGPYNPEYVLAQDLDLWLRLAERYEVAVIPEPLVTIREVPTSLGITRRQQQQIFVVQAMTQSLQRRLIGDCLFPPTQETIARHYLQCAQQSFREDALSESQAYMHKALAIHTFRKNDIELLVESLSSIAFQKWGKSQSQKIDRSSIKEQGTKLVTLLKSVPAIQDVLTNPSRQAIAYFYMNFVFNTNEYIDAKTMFYAYIIAVLNNKRWLLNRGVWSILAKTVIGSK